jgi:hypothetical protein
MPNDARADHGYATRAVALALFAAIGVAACGSLDPQVGEMMPPCRDVDTNPNPCVDSSPNACVSFGKTIRPWMNHSATDPTGHGCKACHYSTESTHLGLDLSGLDLSTLGSLRRGGVTTGTNIVIPGKPCESPLLQKLRGTYAVMPARMPRDGPPYWTNLWIQTVSNWIAEGALGADDE